MDSKINFSNYSKQYDLLLQYSTPYIEVLSIIKNYLAKYFHNSKEISALDVGGGTGNVSQLLLNNHNIRQIDFVEPSNEMISIAKDKMNSPKVQYHHQPFESYNSEKKYDLIICVHSLYLMHDSEKLISRFSHYMHEDSVLLICDVGQEIKIWKWTLYLLWTNVFKYGLFKTINTLFKGKEVRKANSEIQLKQRQGLIWSHTLEIFKNKFVHEYDVLESETCFLKCSNLVICKKK